MKHEESKLQQACVKWFRLQYPNLILFAIPNGGKRGVVEASIMKGEGVTAGVADLFLAKAKVHLFDNTERNSVIEHLPVILSYGCFIEMKVGKGKQTESQKEFEKKVTEQGYQYSVCRTFDEFKSTVETYLNT